MLQEGPEVGHHFFSRNQIFSQPHPAAGPLGQVFAVSIPVAVAGCKLDALAIKPCRLSRFSTSATVSLASSIDTSASLKIGAACKSESAPERVPERSVLAVTGKPPGYDHLSDRQFEFIPIWGIWEYLVFLLYRMRRVDCKACGVIVEAVPWADGKQQLTKAYMLFLARWARKLS